MKKEIKIIVLMILILISINNASASMDYISSGTFDESGVISYDNYLVDALGSYTVGMEDIYFHDFSIYKDGLQFMSIKISGYYFDGVLKATYNSYFENIQLKSGANVVANGKYGYYKTGDNYIIYLWLDLDTWDNHGLSGSQDMDIYGVSNDLIWNIKYVDDLSLTSYPSNIDSDSVLFCDKSSTKRFFITSDMGGYDYNSNGVYSFYNSYDLYKDESLQVLNYSRDSNNKSKIILKDYNNNVLYSETVLDDEKTELSNFNLSPWYLIVEDSYGNLYYDTLIFDIDEDEPTLTTDKTYYNTSEIINISFTNINTIYNECSQSVCVKPYDLHILYPVTDAYKDYESKYIYPLTYNLEDETISLSTSFLSPENNYILGIVGINGNYHKHDDILLFSDSFIVYPDDEYLSVSCDAESECYIYNNADISIYYKINNNSDIIIKDNDNNIINTYHNIIGSGEKLYHIPNDLNHINTYPNWKIYLNNTGYSTSFNKGVTIYWSQFQTPTPTPTFTPQPTPDINISDTINEFKMETQPIKDLIFGLSEIVIDNPDYNKDNIVDESEINHWFNSLIPLCIIFLLIVLYIGLKKNRND